MPGLQLMDTTIRDGQQSLWATRMSLGDMLPILPKMDKVGYWAVEAWGGATFDTCLRFLDENPWERLRSIKAHMPNTDLAMLSRGQNLVGYKHYSKDIVNRFIACAKKDGIQVFRVFDALNDIRNVVDNAEAIKACGGWFEGAISYTVSPVHTLDGFLEYAQKLKDLGADSIAIKDMAGLLTPYRTERLVKAFNAEDKVRKRFSDENNKYRRITQNMHRRYELAHPMSEFLGTATIAVVLWFGGKLILSGNATITAPSFIYYMVIFYSIINPAKDFSKASYAIQRGLASVDRIDKILKADDTIKDPEHPVPLKEMKQGIKYSNVRFRYGDQWVIDGIDLEIGCGKTVALVGQSGSGKTTLADLLPRFYDVEEGSISIDGVDIRDVSKYDLRALMGNVNQEAILFNDTIRNNITFGVESATDEEVIAAAKIANAYDFIMATENGFDTNIGDRGCNLSGGQRQRLSIARAILKNPPILILDEATSALDTESEHLVQQALDNLMHGRTTVVIAHRLSTIKNADLICVLQDGKIIEQGTHDQLIAENGSYKHLVDLQKF